MILLALLGESYPAELIRLLGATKASVLQILRLSSKGLWRAARSVARVGSGSTRDILPPASCKSCWRSSLPVRRRCSASPRPAELAHAAGQVRSRSFLIDVEATSPEAVLNAPLGAGRKPILARVEREAARAFQAFERQRFIMLLDDKQIEGLDDEVTVRAESQIVFLYLMPLKGG